MYLEAVKQDGAILQYIHNQTKEICLEAVKQEGYALQYVHHQTEEICLEAVKQEGYALQFVNKSIFTEKKSKEKSINNLLPKSIKLFQKYILSIDGEFKITSDMIIQGNLKKGKLKEAIIYDKETNCKLQWFKIQGLTTIMVNDVCYAEYTKRIGLHII